MKQPKTFYLVRHGLATHSKRGYGIHKLTTGLLPEGRPAIKRLAEALKDVKESVNISSEIIRCRETSTIISEIIGKNFTFDRRLNENYHETIGQIRARVVAFMDDLQKYPQNNVIICTHGVIIAAIKNLLVNGKFVTSQIADHPLTGELMVIDDKRIQVTSFNTTSTSPRWLNPSS